MKEKLFLTRRWRRMPRSDAHHGKSPWAAVLLMLLSLSLAPQRVQAGDWNWWYPFWDGQTASFGWPQGAEGLIFDLDNGEPYISWKTILFDDDGADEGFFQGAEYGWGLGAHIKIGDLDYVYAGNLCCSSTGQSRRMYNVYSQKSYDATYPARVANDSWQWGGEWSFEYGNGVYDGGNVAWIKPRWYLPFELRNTKVTVRLWGTWYFWTSTYGDPTAVDQTRTVACPYTFTVRPIEYDGHYSVSPDGTVTIPYKFGAAANTDGHTHICTRINNRYNGVIGLKTPPSNYSASSYSFNLKDIGMNLRNSFTFETYHEFSHDNDMDANNGRKNYTSSAGTFTFAGLPKATITDAVFDQANKSVTLTWSADQRNFETGNWGTKWVIYRNNQFVGEVAQSARSFVDNKNLPFETNVTYTIYYVWKDWPVETKLDLLKSNDVTVNTTRTVPVKDLKVESQSDRIVFTWESNGYAAGWGNIFNIYVDNETSPIYTITPSDYQTNFRWEHRATDKHSNRQNGVENGIPYTEEPLNACAPHNYRIEGVIDGKKLNEASVTKRAVGNGTLFYSLEATKGSYAGTVKLSWHVDLQGSGNAKTYTVERRATDKPNESWTTLHRMSSNDDYILYTDDTPLPGVYYDYRVTVIDKCEDGTEVTNDITDIGFAQTTGTVSGRITYGSTGSSVAGVDVVANRTGSSGEYERPYRSIHFTNGSGSVTWKYPSTTYAAEKFALGDFSMQMWIRPEEYKNIWFARFRPGNASIASVALSMFKYDESGNGKQGQLLFCDGQDNQKFDLHLKSGEYNHVTLTRQGNTLICYLIQYDSNGLPVMQKDTVTVAEGMNLDLSSSTIFQLGFIKGFFDDFRLWTKCLSETEILENYDHMLVGNEKGLETYWTFDEGLSSQFFDYSRDGSVYHQHHGTMGNNTESSTVTPANLALKAKTDTDGNYIIQGVPFSGEGTTYAIIPQLGIHEFNPTQQLRFVSNNSLVHNGTDFTDVSSFPVSGNIYYAGTDYPVEGVSLYVDGTVCTKNGEAIQTNANGEFEISVPIGKHFITVAKSGHVFTNAGRFPADPTGLGEEMHLFTQEMTGLTFTDETLVNFTGRVVGGSIEGDKTVGFGLSKNNIGVAEIVLVPTAEDYRMNVDTDMENNALDVPVASATAAIKSTSYRKGGGLSDVKKIVINTDPETGEFSAMIPPIIYQMTRMRLVNDTILNLGEKPLVDLSNPNIVTEDTLYSEDGSTYELYAYNTCMKQTYHSEPTFNVKQQGRDDGSFGISSYKYSDVLGDIEIKDIYTVKNGKVTYNYGNPGAPLFVMKDNYTFLLEGYEEYINADNGEEDHVPLAGNVVTISNALSSEQSVYVESGTVNGEIVKPGQLVDLKSNKLQLDDNGKATYIWKAGLPNIADPFTRTISMTYDIDGRSYQWSGSGMPGIILGELGTGNNFVTTGPQKLEMILRDPPGTNSFTEWKTGSATTETTVLGNTMVENFSASFKHRFGFKENIIFGTPAAGTLEEIESKDDLEIGAKMESELEDNDTYVSTTTVTRTISTSAAPEYVGSQGDVYIGRSTNLVFGKARNVGFRRQADNTFDLGLEDITTTNMTFGTMFMYTQNYIENTLIPNYKLLRNSLITPTVADTIKKYKNNTDHYVYLTTLNKDDEHFGEPGTFTTFEPDQANVSGVAKDEVLAYNTEIENWQGFISSNEEVKWKAFDKRETFLVGDNISFDSGTSYTYEIEESNDTTTTREWNVKAGVVVDNTLGFNFKGFGFEIHLQDETMGGRHEVHSDGNTETATFSYTLAEDGDDDALSVDVLQYDAFGPIFHTRGGQTCCPYEGEERTKYYADDNGNHPVINEATMQIEVPQINVDVPILSDIPSGGTADYTLRLSNASEIDEDVYYRLLVDDETNPDGANLTIDGRPVTDSRIIKIPAGQTVTKALQLKQTNYSVLDYDSIAIVLGSQCQIDPTSTWDVIADTVWVSAHFVPSSSPVELALSNTLMNTETGSVLTATISGFDRNYRGLKAFRLQYKKQGATDWLQIHEYVLDSADVTTSNELLPATGARVSYTLPMAEFNDGNYLFRVVSASIYGTSEVYRYSNEIALVKDMQRPAPLGLPEPSDGIMETGDNISITFNEDFLKGALTKTANFRVKGVLNGAEIDHETALRTSGGESPAAQTEAGITLAGKDFAVDMWVNIRNAGTLISHGSGASKMIVATDANKHLVITLGNDTYTSAGTMPTDEWCFLTISYQQTEEGGKLTAAVAVDSETTQFFNNKDVVKYDGAGPLAVGKDLNGAIHELLLWDEAHDLTTALANRTKTKNPSTRHLIGYWKMDEGEGKKITDYARYRHMTMPDETWYLNNENLGVSLDGQHRISVDASTLQLFENDDYALEFWMRGETQQEAQLLQMGEVALWVNANGELKLNGKGAYKPDAEASAIATTSGSILDNAWHHIALNVLRQGAAAVYVDGKRVLTTNAANVGAINTNQLIVGAKRTTVMSGETGLYAFERPFKGEIDEVRVWGASMNADLLAKQRRIRLTGSEDGLLAYFPFEKKTKDNYNQMVTEGDDTDLTGSGVTAQLLTLNSQLSTLNYVDEAPALRTKPTETNVEFSFTASDNKIVITIDEDPATIEGCTLNFTVRDVSDLNGNYSLPATWSAFVNCKQLVWKDDELTVNQAANSSTTVTNSIINKGGSMQMWTLSGMPSWLQASMESGTTNPLAETKVTFTVTEATPIGKYEETIYLTGTDGIEVPLTIRVTVKGKEPDWAVDETAFEGSMNLIGNLEILGVPSEDADDIVGAFIDGECRGVAHPKYDKDFDFYFVLMDIFGNGRDSGREVVFKVYDASTGETYPVVQTSLPVKFEAYSLAGDFDDPLVLSAVNVQEQQLALSTGWTWFSLFVEPDDMKVPVVFAPVTDAVSIVKNQQRYLSYSNGSWLGKQFSLGSQSMYQVKMNEARTITLRGKKVNPQEKPIALSKGWNWVAYNVSQTMSVTDALADMDPQDGDYVKGQKGFASYKRGKWMGSLTALIPGQGYMIQVSDARTFRYPKATAAANARMAFEYEEQPIFFTPVDFHNYADNMTVIARVMTDGLPASGVEVGVFAGEECRAAGISNDEGLVFLTIPGDGRTQLVFRIADGDIPVDCDTTLEYASNAITGTIDEPFILNAFLTGINNVNGYTADSKFYDLQGRRVYRQTEGVQRSTLKKGVYIENGQKRVKK